MALTTNIESVWHFDEASGNALDAVGSNTLTSSFIGTESGTTTGKLGGARTFDGGSPHFQNFNHADNASLSVGDIDFAFSAWVYFNSVSGTKVILCKASDLGGSFSGIEYALDLSTVFQFVVSDGTIRTVVSHGLTATTGTWYFVFAYHDSVNNQIGILVNDSGLVTASHSTGVQNSTQTFFIGQDGSGRYMNGYIDEVVYWKNYIPTVAERSVLYNQGRGLAYPFTYDLTTMLVSVWHLDEASGTRVDSIGGNDLTDNNTVTSTTGKLSSAAQFTAANSEYLSHADNAALSTGDIDFSFSCWVKLSSNAADMQIITKYNDSPQFEYKLYYDQFSNKFQFQVWDQSVSNAGTVSATNFGTLSTGVWYHVVVYHDSVNNTIGIVVNGVENTVAFTFGVRDGTASFQLGRRGSGSPADYFDGLLDEVLFWKRAITATERNVLYNLGSGFAYPFTYTLTTALYAYWKLDEASGNAIDSLGANDLTDNGSVGSTTGKISNARVISSNYLSNAGLSVLGSVTVAGWVYFTSSATFQAIVTKGTNSSWASNNYILATGAGGFRFKGTFGSLDAGSWTTGQWYHVAASYDETTIRIYVNGSLAGSGAGSAAMSAVGTAFRIGTDDGTDPFGGRVDEFGVWGRALTAAEVTSLYASGSGFTYPFSTSTTFTATAALTVGHATASGSATFSKPTYTASAVVSVGHATASLAGTFAVNTYTATAAVSVSHATASGSVTFTKPTYTASAAMSVGHAVASGSATFTKPTYTATATVSAGHVTVAGVATFAKPTYTASAAVTIGHATAAGSAVFANAVYVASASVTVGHATTSLAGTFAKPTYTASATLSVGHASAAGTGTSARPTYTGAAAVSAGHALASGSATFVPVFRVLGAVTTGAATAALVGTFVKPAYTGVLAVTTGHATVSGFADDGVNVFVVNAFHGQVFIPHATAGEVLPPGVALYGMVE